MSDLYDNDTAAWSEHQAGLLRRVAAGERPNTVPDWTNIAEEIDSLGRDRARELASRITVILVHLIKLQASPAQEPRVGWRATVRRERDEIDRLFDDSPSLRRRVQAGIAGNLDRARKEASISLADNGETPVCGIALLTYTEEQVMENWWP